MEKDYKYFVYQHTRLDKNEVFYIGIGTKTRPGKSKTSYKRAYDKVASKGRNAHWLNIVAKTEYSIDIIFESDDYEEVKLKEIELIRFYGKRCDNGGTLVNLSDGGEGSTGFKFTEEQKQIMSDHSWIKGKFGYENHLSKEVFVYNTNGEFIRSFGSQNQCSQELNVDISGIYQVLKNKIKQCNGYIFFSTFKGESIPKLENFGKNSTRKKKVAALNKDLTIFKEFDTVTEAAKFVNGQTSNISKACKNKSSTYKGYYWKYINEKTN